MEFMSALRFSRTLRRLAGVFHLALFVMLPWRDAAVAQSGPGMVRTLNAPAGPVESGSRLEVTLTFLNDSPTELIHTFPETLRGRFAGGPVDSTVELNLISSGEPAEARIPAGRFVRRSYAAALPNLPAGRVMLELTEPAGLNPVFLEIAPRNVAAQEPTKPGEGAFVRFFKEAVLKDEAFDSGAFFKQHISGHEPFYFIASTESPNAKFQVSFKYQLVNANSRLAERAPMLKGFHFAYSQTSLWDWNGESAPFFDSSYRPEMLYLWDRALGGGSSDWFRLDLQAGAQHESNGKGGVDSRSLNIAYLRPTLTLGSPDSLQLSLSPRAWVYVIDLDDNRDLKDYRGYVDLRAVVGWAKGVQLSATGRMGDDRNRGSIQLDLTYPMMKLLSGSFSLYLHAQYFNGYGESLLLYNERGDSWRIGFSFYR